MKYKQQNECIDTNINNINNVNNIYDKNNVCINNIYKQYDKI